MQEQLILHETEVFEKTLQHLKSQLEKVRNQIPEDIYQELVSFLEERKMRTEYVCIPNYFREKDEVTKIAGIVCFLALNLEECKEKLEEYKKLHRCPDWEWSIFAQVN